MYTRGVTSVFYSLFLRFSRVSGFGASDMGDTARAVPLARTHNNNTGPRPETGSGRPDSSDRPESFAVAHTRERAALVEKT